MASGFAFGKSIHVPVDVDRQAGLAHRHSSARRRAMIGPPPKRSTEALHSRSITTPLLGIAVRQQVSTTAVRARLTTCLVDETCMHCSPSSRTIISCNACPIMLRSPCPVQVGPPTLSHGRLLPISRSSLQRAQRPPSGVGRRLIASRRIWYCARHACSMRRGPQHHVRPDDAAATSQCQVP